MPTLKELYTALKEDGAPVPDTYDQFHDYMTSGPGNGYEHRREVYEALKEDGAPLPATYEEFSQALFAPVNSRKNVTKSSVIKTPAMNDAAAAAAPIPGRAPSPEVEEMEREAVRYEDRQGGAEATASPVVKAQASGRKTPTVSAAKAPTSTPRQQAPSGAGVGGSGMMDAVAESAAKSMKKAKVSARAGEMMRNYRLRRGGKDFDVPESEVMFYGGFDKWAQAHKGAPVRVYMRHRDGRRVHVPVSQVARLAGEGWYAEARRDEPRLPSESGASPHGGRPVTAADKAYYAHQLADVMQDSRARTRAGQQRVEGMTDYMRSGEALTGAAVDDGMHVDPSDGKLKKRYLLPTGERTFDAAESESVARAYRVETERQREEARRLQHPEYEELVARRDAVWKEIHEMQSKRGEAIDQGSEGPREGESAWDAFVRIAGGASARANDAMHAHPTGKEAGISGKPGEERMKQLWAELLELDAAVRRVAQATKYKYNLDNLGGVLGTVENFGEGIIDALTDPDTLTMGMTRKSRESELNAAQGESASSRDEGQRRLMDSSVMSESAIRNVGTLRAMDVSGGVTRMMADPLMWLTAPVGGVAARRATQLLGKHLLKGGTRAMAARVGASQLSARLLPKMAVGAAHGAGTFGAYEGASDLRDQILHGGYVNPETGENEGYSVLPILNSTAHGVMMGGLTGATGALLGNVADKYVRMSGPVGKVALRGAETAVSTVADGTIFSIPEWIEGRRDAMDVWNDNVAMMLGFKAMGSVKSAPGFIRSLRAVRPQDGRPLTMSERMHNNRSFMERLAERMDSPGEGMAFTADELAEMRRYGYGDFSELFSRRKDAEKPSSEATASKVPDVPGAVPERVHHPELDDYEMMERFMQDGRVSQAARAKAYFILTGRGVPMSTVAGYESKRTADGAYVVNAVAVDGEVVISRTFRNETDASREIEKIERQVELNTVDVGERFRESEATARSMAAAYADVAALQGGGLSPEMVRKAYEQAVRDLANSGLAESSRRPLEDLVKEVETALKAHEDDFAASTPEAIRRDIEAEYKVTIDAVLRKRAASRSAAEKEALQDYVERLFPVEAREGAAEAAAPEQKTSAEDAGLAGAEDTPIGRAVMKYQDRPVEVMSGRVVMTDDGAMVDRERSDATVVVRDPETGKVEMVSPEAILTYEDYAGDEAAVLADAEAAAEATEQNSDASAAGENRGVVEGTQTEGSAAPKYGAGDSFRVKVPGRVDSLPAGVVDSEGERVLIWTYAPIGEASEKASTMPGYLTDVTRGELDGMLERDNQGNPVQYVRAQNAVIPNPEGGVSTEEELADGVSAAKTLSAAEDSVGSAVLTADLRETEEAMSASEPVEARIPKLSTEERDEYGKPMVLAEDGTTTFGVVESESGLAAAPIRLSLGENSVGQDGKNHGYGLLHIEAGHGDQIRAAGFESVVEFVESVARNYSTIREGGVIAGNQTYLLEVPDGHNNTLFIQLSKDGKYWNVNSAGIFKEKYSRRKPKVYDVPALGGGKGTDTTGVDSGHDEGATAPAGDSPETFGGKVNALSSDKQGNGSESSDDGSQAAASEQRAEVELTALDRIPRDEKNEPVFELAENPETGWDALVEFSEGDAATAKAIADTMAEEKRKAYEKAQKLKPKGKTPTEILASKKANAAQLAQAENEYNLWQRMAGVEQSRQDAIRSQQEAEARRLAAERAEAEKAEREAREEAARLEREALEGIPEWHMDTPENARKRGARRFSGQMFTRQEPVQSVVGNEVEVKFSQKDLPKGRVAVIEASQLQPSHIQGQRNPLFFIDEAQPKNRAEAVSMYAAKEMAEGIRPQEITGSATAYTGAPTVNTRGEVIQGNNRSDALRFLWENNLPTQQQTYKQYLLDNAEQFGIDPEAVNAMQHPVLVNMLDVDDTEAIRLGQMTAQDTESGGIERIKPRNVAQKLGEDMRTFANRLLNSGDEEASFGQLVDRNGTDVLKWMNQVGAITNTQYQSAFDSKGNLTAEAKNDLQKVLYQAVFKGGSQQLEEMFDKLPAKAQRAILSTAFRDMDSPFAGKMLPEIQSSIMAYNLLMNDPAFAEAKNMEQVLRAISAFKSAIALDDRFEQYMPADNFSNFALHLAGMYKASDMSQSTIASYFNQMYDFAQGKKAATLFEEADTTEYPLAEVINKVLNIQYQPAKNGNNNVANGGADVALRNRTGQDGESRGSEPPASREQTEAGAEPSERGGRTVLPVAERGGQGNIHSTQRPEPSNLSQTEAEGIDYEYVLSDEMDQNGRPFVLTSKGDLEFGRIERQSGLAEAPILLSEGIITNPKTKEGYGLIHIEARHGKQIRQNGYANAVEFIEDVANNWEAIMEAKNRNGNPTFRLIAKGKHNNTIMVELSGDGTYWNINTAGIFKTSYGKNAKEVYNRHTTDKPIAESVEASQDSELSGTTESSRMNAPTSERKVTNSASDKQENSAESSVQPTDNKGVQTIQTAVEAASSEVNTEPTPAQAEAGNYKKGHVTIGEFDITIENPAGSVRKGVDADGKEWSTTMSNAYGYIKGTEGVDGDHIDVFLHQNMDEWNGRKVYVVDQTNIDGSFDEHKVMLGFNDKEEAMSAYLANYDSTWGQTHPGLRISETNIEDFNKWVQSSHRKTKPFADYSTVSKITHEGSKMVAYRNLKDNLNKVGGTTLLDVVNVEGNNTRSANDDGLLYELGSEYGASTEAKSSHAERMSKKFNTPIRIVTDTKELTNDNSERQARMRRSKGFYDPATGEVVIVLPNNANVEDVAETVFHEVVAHKGLREMIGEENYDAFCDEIYNHLKDDLKQQVEEDATRRFVNEPGKEYEHHRRVAVDEMFGRMSEKGFEDFTKAERGIWVKLKAKVLEAINKFLGSLKLPKWVKLGDNELRYMLWRSHEKLRTKGDYVDMARDAAKREDLGLRRNEAVRVRTDEANIEEVNRRFNEQLQRWESGIMEGKAVIEAGRPLGIMRHFMPDEILTLRQKVLTKARKKHGLTGADIKGLPGALSSPIFVFKSVPQTVSVLTELKSSSGQNLFVAVEVGVSKQFGHRILEVNDILTIHGREVENVVYPIIENKTLVWVDKEKGLEWLSSAKSNSQAITSQTLEDAAKIVNSFDNPTITEEESLNFRFRDGETSDIWKDHSMGLEECITKTVIRMSEAQREDRNLRNEARQAVLSNLQSLLHDMRNKRGRVRSFVGANRKVEAGVREAMTAQARYDRSTVKRVSDLARVLMQTGYLSGMTSGEMQRLLSVVKNAPAMHDVSDSVQKIMDIMVNNQLRNAEGALRQLLSIRGSKVAARGVEVQGKLDVRGQRVIRIFKEAILLTDDNIRRHLEEAMEVKGDSRASVSAKENAAIDYAGLELAQYYVDNIQESKAEEANLRRSLRKEKERYRESTRGLREERAAVGREIRAAAKELQGGQITQAQFEEVRSRATRRKSEARETLRPQYEAYCETVEAIEENMRKNRIERAKAYDYLVERLEEVVRGSIDKAREFREREQERVNTILHHANSDMEGRPHFSHNRTGSGKKSKKDTLINAAANTLLSPLGTFEQYFRVFGSKSVDGRGYLFEDFVVGMQACRDKEWQDLQRVEGRLNEKASRVLGKKKALWTTLNSLASKEACTVSWRDGEEMREFTVTQGNVMYVYMAEKMSDGRVKLRSMGITGKKVDELTAIMDPKLRKLADWIQEDFLPEFRDEINEVHERMFGAPMASIEDYFPLLVLANARMQKEDMTAYTDGDELPKTMTGALVKRRFNTCDLDILHANPIDIVIDHVRELLEWKNMAEYRRDLGTLLSYKRFRNQVKNMRTVYGAGEENWRHFKKLALLVAGVYKPETGKFDRAMVNLTKLRTGACIALNFNSALKQLLSYPAFLSDANVIRLLYNITPDRAVECWAWAMDNMPAFQRRWKSRQAGNEILRDWDGDWDWTKKAWVQKLQRAGMTLNAFIDGLTVAMGSEAVYHSKYKGYVRDGFTEEQAHRKAVLDAEMVFNLSQQSGEAMYISLLQNNRSYITQAFTNFRNSSMAYTRQVVESMREAGNMVKHGKEQIEFEKKKAMREGLSEEKAERRARRKYHRQWGKAVTALGTFAVLLPALWKFGLEGAWYSIFGENEEEKKIDAENAIKRGLEFGWMEGLAGGGTVPDLLYSWLEGEPVHFDEQTSPASASLVELINAWGDGETDKAVHESVNLCVALLSGANSQYVEDVIVAGLDFFANDEKMRRDYNMLVMRLLSVPQSQLDRIYFDELGADARVAQRMSPRELAERYAAYKVRRYNFETVWFRGDSVQEDMKEPWVKRFNKEAKARLAAQSDEGVSERLAAYDAEWSETGRRLREARESADYTEYAERAAVIIQSPEGVRYRLYKELHPYLNKMIKSWLEAESAEEAAREVETIIRYKAKVVEMLDAWESPVRSGTAGAQAEAIASEWESRHKPEK